MNNKDLKLIDDIRALAYKNYEKGGDIIIECLEDHEILEHMNSIKDAKDFMNLKFEQRREVESTIF